MTICDRCQKPVATVAGDALYITSLGSHHYACMRAAWAEANRVESEKREATRARRSAMMKERWADHESVPVEDAPLGDNNG